MRCEAVIDGDYRYWLRREWATGRTCLFVMLNPSTADATEDDPTIKRCIEFARREGCGALEVVNLFALRSTCRETMKRHPDPIGPMNDGWIAGRSISVDGPIIAGWGNDGIHMAREAEVRKLLYGRSVKCLKITKSGQPWHPLYLKGDLPLIDLPMGAAE